MVGYLMDELHPQKKGWRALLFFFFRLLEDNLS